MMINSTATRRWVFLLGVCSLFRHAALGVDSSSRRIHEETVDVVVGGANEEKDDWMHLQEDEDRKLSSIKWYVDWDHDQCVQSCRKNASYKNNNNKSRNQSCGGRAPRSLPRNELFDTAESCCGEMLTSISFNECIKPTLLRLKGDNGGEEKTMQMGRKTKPEKNRNEGNRNDGNIINARNSTGNIGSGDTDEINVEENGSGAGESEEGEVDESGAGESDQGEVNGSGAGVDWYNNGRLNGQGEVNGSGAGVDWYNNGRFNGQGEVNGSGAGVDWYNNGRLNGQGGVNGSGAGESEQGEVDGSGAGESKQGEVDGSGAGESEQGEVDGSGAGESEQGEVDRSEVRVGRGGDGGGKYKPNKNFKNRQNRKRHHIKQRTKVSVPSLFV